MDQLYFMLIVHWYGLCYNKNCIYLNVKVVQVSPASDEVSEANCEELKRACPFYSEMSTDWIQ